VKLYRHYKNKPYSFTGLARHSETGEEMVIYETRYESPGGRIWVRPSAMFFEPVALDGRSVPRFQEIPLELKTFTEISNAEADIIGTIGREMIEGWDQEDVLSRLGNAPKVYLQLAYVEGECAGFKLGYEKSNSEFYSWLGGVRTQFRGLGIASDLMRAQHDWCRRQEYQKVSTKTKNRYREMLILNVKHGFDVVGTEVSEGGEIKIAMVKNL
jgi:GNAT superfamily N-acetyltransferase